MSIPFIRTIHFHRPFQGGSAYVEMQFAASIGEQANECRILPSASRQAARLRPTPLRRSSLRRLNGSYWRSTASCAHSRSKRQRLATQWAVKQRAIVRDAISKLRPASSRFRSSEYGLDKAKQPGERNSMTPRNLRAIPMPTGLSSTASLSLANMRPLAFAASRWRQATIRGRLSCTCVGERWTLIDGRGP